ncbi:bifunctional adenosylcobinamide kinase/adenosylcobinamide-phosphate guanylyltransferase [Alkalihalobacillus sp. AL-G]|uniref:bifunctional adenosylcobinamide kinase/adenosylcobinamide-phosphate guanylyltransferase n=1 Tax=Alkalihalobacillus sp. AL-G TaxID=2926399 RepID=UPI00272C78CB|nr:bifunctional adenosylcobinamide kinase/adenosylcobinamide-phosphate guanylyltransferase [Alkalihalobacillus sp. AL-G]WLD91662.1 bifunctional adenosylcobinamide kinase/adenosylcobinamide-phosphate guanylyltransferase [Alkalihalobacillus sp. AL-G]
METTRSLIFITGGVRSGKSSFAEKLAIQLATGSSRSLHYIATGERSDSEMEKRIQKHRQQRKESESQWTTWEQPRNIGTLATHFSDDDILLLDCLTTLLNNELFSTGADQQSSMNAILQGIEALSRCCHTLIIVSNEVLNEPIQDNQLVFTYKKVLGHLHQMIVQRALRAYLVESGVEIEMKGEIP